MEEKFRFEYSEKEDGYVLTKYIPLDQESGVLVPKQYEGKPVVRIGKSAFTYVELLKGVVVPNTVKKIDAHAFEGNKNLEEVVIPVMCDVELFAFTGSEKMVLCDLDEPELYKNFYIDGKRELWYDWSSPSAKGDLILPTRYKGVFVSRISKTSFYNNSKLKSVEIGGFYSIPDETFKFCSSLEKVVFHSGTKEIGNGAFYGTSALESVILPPSCTKIGDSAFSSCGCKTLILNEGLREIGAQAFSYAENIEEVVIPSSCREIGEEAFYRCKNLKRVIFHAEAPRIEIHPKAFAKSGIQRIVLPAANKWTKPFKMGMFTSDLIPEYHKSDKEEIYHYPLKHEREIAKRQEDDIYFFHSSRHGGYLVDGYKGTDERLIIPEEYQGEPVVGIRYQAFEKVGPHSIMLPKTCRYIEQYAFSNNPDIKHIGIYGNPGELKVDKNAFCGALYIKGEEDVTYYDIPEIQEKVGIWEIPSDKELEVISDPFVEEGWILTGYHGKSKYINLPELCRGIPITRIGKYAFLYSDMKGIKIPNKCQVIDEHAFSYCENLEIVEMENSQIQQIEFMAFRNCTALKEVTIPKTCRKIDKDAFAGCTCRQRKPENNGEQHIDEKKVCVQVKQNFEYIYNEEGEYYILSKCITNGEEVIVPDEHQGKRVGEIGEGAFRGQETIRKVVLPINCLKIGSEAFAGVANLEYIVMSRFCEWEAESFDDSSKIHFQLVWWIDENIESPCERYIYEEIYDRFVYRHFSDEDFYTITKYLEREDEREVTIPERYNGKDVGRIGMRAFVGCKAVEKVVIPSTCRTIGRDAFKGVKSLKQVEFSEGLEKISEGAFADSGLNKMKIPFTCKEIGDAAFARTKIVRVVIPGSVTKLGAMAFSKCEELEEVFIRNGVKRLEHSTFSGTEALERIQLPKSLEVIGEWCFEKSGIQEIKMPSNVEEIGENCFENSRLKKVILSKEMKGVAVNFGGSDLIKLEIE